METTRRKSEFSLTSQRDAAKVILDHFAPTTATTTTKIPSELARRSMPVLLAVVVRTRVHALGVLPPRLRPPPFNCGGFVLEFLAKITGRAAAATTERSESAQSARNLGFGHIVLNGRHDCVWLCSLTFQQRTRMQEEKKRGVVNQSRRPGWRAIAFRSCL